MQFQRIAGERRACRCHGVGRMQQRCAAGPASRKRRCSRSRAPGDWHVNYLDGQITPLEQATLSFQQSGPVLAMYVNIGDRVHAGQLLAQIDPSTLRAELAQAEAAAAQASATARGSQIGLPVAVTSNTSALSTAKAAFENAQLIYRQISSSLRKGMFRSSS